MKIIESIFEFRFIIELIVLSFLFTTGFPKRKHFSWRIFFLAMIFLFSAGLFLYLNMDWMTSLPFAITRYIILFIIVVVCIMFCYSVQLPTSLFVVTGVYAIQHLIYNLHEIIMVGLDVNSYITQSYTSYILYVTLYTLIETVLFILIYLFYIKKFKSQDEKYFHNKFIIELSIFVNLYATVFSIVFRISQDNAQTEIFMISVLLDILCCLFTMYLLYYIFRTSVLQDEVNIIRSLLKKEKNQFARSQANIQLINIKVHDLKHQLTQLTKSISQDEMEELKKIISIYDIPKTGNAVLDVVIAEKKLQCEQENIEFTCIVDGEKLDFVSEADLYSLFGNAFENAINAVRSLKDREKRVISLQVKEKVGLVSVHFENYFDTDLVFEEGLPVTTKKDRDYHGYGMKSIKYLVEKYGGELSIKVDEDIFNLNIIFPSKHT